MFFTTGCPLLSSIPYIMDCVHLFFASVVKQIPFPLPAAPAGCVYISTICSISFQSFTAGYLPFYQLIYYNWLAACLNHAISTREVLCSRTKESALFYTSFYTEQTAPPDITNWFHIARCTAITDLRLSKRNKINLNESSTKKLHLGKKIVSLVGECPTLIAMKNMFQLCSLSDSI